MKRLYLFTLEIVPLEVGRTYDDLPSHLTLMSRFLSELAPQEIAQKVRSVAQKTPPVSLTFGHAEKLGPKQVTAHMVISPAEQQLHKDIKAVLDDLKVTYQYPEFIGNGHKAHVTARAGVDFLPGQTQTAQNIYLIEVVNKKRVIRAVLPLEACKETQQKDAQLGLKRGTVQLSDYNPAWPKAFEQEKDLLTKTLGIKNLQIEHIGSTSVPGLAAKPIIDMIIAVDSFDEVDTHIKPLQQIGYSYMPQRMFADRKFFPKGPEACKTHHLNFVLKDNLEQWRRPIAFRDYLRTHPEARNEYAQLKYTLAKAHATNRKDYTMAKAHFIESAAKTE